MGFNQWGTRWYRAPELILLQENYTEAPGRSKYAQISPRDDVHHNGSIDVQSISINPIIPQNFPNQSRLVAASFRLIDKLLYLYLFTVACLANMRHALSFSFRPAWSFYPLLSLLCLHWFVGVLRWEFQLDNV